MNQNNTPIKNLRGNSAGGALPQSYQVGHQSSANDSSGGFQQQYQQNYSIPISLQQQQRGSSAQKFPNPNIPIYHQQVQVPAQSYLVQNGQQSSQSNFAMISPAKARHPSCEPGIGQQPANANMQSLAIQAQIQQKQGRNNLTPTKQRYMNQFYNPQTFMNGGNSSGIPGSAQQPNGVYNYSIQQRQSLLQHSNSKGNQINANNRSLLNNNNSSNNINNTSNNNILNSSGYGVIPNNAGSSPNTINNHNTNSNSANQNSSNNLQIAAPSPVTYSINGNLAQILSVAGGSSSSSGKVPSIIQQQKSQQQQIGLLKPIHHQVILSSPTKDNGHLKSASLPKQNNQFSLINNILDNGIPQANQVSINGGSSAKKFGSFSQQSQQQQPQQTILTNASVSQLNTNNSIYGPSPQKVKAEPSEQVQQQQQQLPQAAINQSVNGQVVIGQAQQAQLSAGKQTAHLLQNSITSKLVAPNNYHIQPLHKSISIHQDQRHIISNSNLPIIQNVQTPTLQNNFANQKNLENNLKEAQNEKEILRQKLVKQDKELSDLTEQNEKLNQLVQAYIDEKKQFEKSSKEVPTIIVRDANGETEAVKKSQNPNKNGVHEYEVAEEDGVNFGSKCDPYELEKLSDENKQLSEMVTVLERRINQMMASNQEEYENGKKDSNYTSNQDEVQLIQLENEDLRKKIAILIETNEKNMEYYPEVIAQQENKLQLLAEENNNLNSVIRSKVEEIDQIHDKYSNEIQKLKQSDKLSKELESVYQQLKKQFDALQNDYILVNQEKEAHKSEKVSLEGELNSNKMIIENNKEIIDQYEQKVTEILEDRDRLKAEFDQNIDDINQYKEDQNNLLQQIENMNQIIINFNNELQPQKEQNQILEGNVMELTRQLEVLINENDKLNNYIQSQNKEDFSDQEEVQGLLREKDVLIADLQKQLDELVNQKNLESNDYEIIIQEQKDILKELEEKVQLLLQENDKLNQIVQNQQLTPNDYQLIAEMEARLQEIAEENQKLLISGEKYKSEAEMWKKQALQQASVSTSATSLPPTSHQQYSNAAQNQNAAQAMAQNQQYQQQGLKQFSNSSPSSSGHQNGIPNQQLNWQMVQQQQLQQQQQQQQQQQSQQSQHPDMTGSWHNQSSSFSNNQSEQQLPSVQYLQQQQQQIAQQASNIPQFGQVYAQPQVNLTQKRFPSAGKQLQQQQYQ